MIQDLRFTRGDAVRHPKRPEWGVGTVQKAESMQHAGQSAQRLTVQFTNQGRVVINTAVATLLRMDETTGMTQSTTSKGWLDELEQSQGKRSNALTELPDELTDPFLSEARRLENTLRAYRFSTEPRPLIDWAVAQTGQNDPLSTHTRHELEEAFRRYAHLREQHLKELVRQMKRAGQQAQIKQVAQAHNIPQAAKEAVERALRA